MSRWAKPVTQTPSMDDQSRVEELSDSDYDPDLATALNEGPWTNREGERLGDFGVDEDEER